MQTLYIVGAVVAFLVGLVWAVTEVRVEAKQDDPPDDLGGLFFMTFFVTVPAAIVWPISALIVLLSLVAIPQQRKRMIPKLREAWT